MKKQHFIFYLQAILVLFSGMANAQSITLAPKWTAQAQFAGYYVADKMGFYKEEGLDVQIKHPAVSESSFSTLLKNDAQAAVMNLSFALTTLASSIDVVNIMQTSQENSLMLVSRQPIKNEESLRHKDIAVWNHLSNELLDKMAAHYKLDGKWIRFNGGVNLFLAGAVDICLVGSYNEYIQLAECGLQPDSTYTFRLADYGYNLPEDGLYVTKEFYDKYPETVKKLARASIRGWEWANEHREETLDIVMDIVRENNIGTNRYHQRMMLEEILRLQLDKNNERTFHLSREAFDHACSILLNDKEKESLHYTDFVK